MPIPIPAPNIMENHEKLENSGLSSGRPSFVLPTDGHKASARHTTIKNDIAYMYQAPVFASIVERIAFSALPAASDQTAAHITSNPIRTFEPTVTMVLKPS